MLRYLAIWVLVLAAAPLCAAEDDGDKAFKETLENWKVAWNGGKPDALVALFHPKSIWRSDSAADRVKKRLAMRSSSYGQIKAMRFIGSYDDRSACCVRMDFTHNADFPVVFLLSNHGDKVMISDFLPGQDPSVEADKTVVAEFLKGWKTSWNSGKADSMLEQMHPFGKAPLAVAAGLIPKEGLAREMEAMLQKFGTIQSAEIKGFKTRTNEYSVEFTYAKAGKIAAAMNLQKDAKGTWRVFSFDIDDGERALKAPNSWRCQ
ncbi:MAG: hypothetical protein HQ567_18725 [Candidatus Nealsonbacteria bacterium]|nr:hypothetical protein [Candidatus Nealsonbacteria bacterium]